MSALACSADGAGGVAPGELTSAEMVKALRERLLKVIELILDPTTPFHKDYVQLSADKRLDMPELRSDENGNQITVEQPRMKNMLAELEVAKKSTQSTNYRSIPPPLLLYRPHVREVSLT